MTEETERTTTVRTDIPKIIQTQSDRAPNLKLYFDEKLHPHLAAALAACAQEMPDDPVKFVGNFLLERAN